MTHSNSTTAGAAALSSFQAQQQVSPQELLRLETLSSLEKYTRAMFRAQYKRAFAVSYHHRKIFKALEDVVDGKCKRLIINVPPRYSKTEIVIKAFISWGFALNPACRFLHLSYSDMLVNDNSSTVRNIMSDPLYKQLFPQTALEKERGASNYWKTTGGGEFYAVSTQGQVTGFGAGKVDNTDEDNAATAALFTSYDQELANMLTLIEASKNVFQGAIMIDDPLKPEDALSDTVRERINQRFENTIRNRTNSRNTPIVIIMQRLHEHDLCGYLQEIEPNEWTVLSLSAIQMDQDNNEYPLWPLKHTLQELHSMRDINSLVFDTQYMQDPKPKEGLMYSSGFRTYDSAQLPMGQNAKRFNYTDTADTGADFLCSINFIDTPEFVYVTDVVYTNKPMEVTEPLVADLLHRGGTVVAKIEGNNGGRGFGRSVERILRLKYHNFRTKITMFMQSNNKYVRIFTRSAEVQNTILMPADWERRWPLFYGALTSYRKDNKRRSQHDDAADAITGVIEMRGTAAMKKKIKSTNDVR